MEEVEKIKKILEEERKKIEETQIYKFLAKSSPAFAELLEKYQKLQEEI